MTKTYFTEEGVQVSGDGLDHLREAKLDVALEIAHAENDRLRAQVERLREVLEPFAAIADIFDSEVEGHSDTDELSLFYGDDARWLVARFTLAQFNAALFSISEDRE